jgi:hypothetical protein
MQTPMSPRPGGPELPAAKGNLFARDRSERGQRHGPSARCWAPIGGLSRAARVYMLVGFTLASVQAWMTQESFRPTTERGTAATGGHHCLSLVARSESCPQLLHNGRGNLRSRNSLYKG